MDLFCTGLAILQRWLSGRKLAVDVRNRPESEAAGFDIPHAYCAFMVPTDSVLEDAVVEYLDGWARMPMDARAPEHLNGPA